MIVRLKPEALKQSSRGELVARFLLGGLAPVLMRIVTNVGGLTSAVTEKPGLLIAQTQGKQLHFGPVCLESLGMQQILQ